LSKSITIEQFESLKKSDKADVVFVFGVYLMHFENVRHIFALYNLGSFYVEMVYDNNPKKVLRRIKSHYSPDSLEKYLLKINIEELQV
jgi:hypothetical protein